jgi:3-phenylpropionate/trans-cinnamate dioxygenase ferredoxin reductase subunit
MVSSTGVVVLGAGQAGFQAATSLRDFGYDGRITLVGEEPEPPYERPPLTKAYLLGDKDRAALQLRPPDHYRSRAIDLLLGEVATEIDSRGRVVHLRSGARLSYAHLILATGARHRRLSEAFGHHDVVYVRTLAEVDALRERLAIAQNVAIVGGGFIGLELAAALRKQGKTAHVLEAMPRVMARAVSSPISDVFAEAHRGWGVQIVTGCTVSSIEVEGDRVTGVRTRDGNVFAADLVVAGIGVIANSELAAAAALPVRDGIVVDDHLRTPDPTISAIGDCAAAPSLFCEGLVRLESVQNAADQARCVAARLTGKPAPYTAVPWFWSDQGDLKLQMVGLTAGCDSTVIRGSLEARKFSVFCFRGEKLVGIESVNKPADHMFGRKLLGLGATISPAQAADLGFDFKTHLAHCSADMTSADESRRTG